MLNPVYKKPHVINTLLMLTISLMTFSYSAVSVDNAYYRDPDLHGNNLVFTSQGDLWLLDITSSVNAGIAKRLTSHPNLERSAKFSPDGKRIAFVASYNNLPAVYVMSTNGGVAKQVSFEHGRTLFHGWADNQHVLISANSETRMHISWELKKVNIESLSIETFEVSDAFEGILNDKQDQLFFVQHGLQVSTDNAAFYKGGAAGKLWKFDVASRSKNKEAINLTSSHDGSVHTPMLHENTSRLYFISNSAGIDNIYSMKLDGKDIKQHTKFDYWAVRQASMDGNKIVFQHGADIKVFDVTTESVKNIDIALRSDFTDLRTRYINQPLEYFNSASASNNGIDAVVTARGKLVVANNNKKRLVEVATQTDSRVRNAILSKDSNYIYAISDASGDYEIWRFSADGSQTSTQLTNNGRVLKTNLWESPDGEYLAFTEKSGKVFLLNIETQGVHQIEHESVHMVSDVRFSSNSEYIAIVFTAKDSQRSQIYLHEISSNQGAVLTTDKYNSASPSFSDDFNWLYFLSQRHFNPEPSSPWGDRNMGVSFDKRTQVFAIALNKNTSFPFAVPTELDKQNSPAKDSDGDDEKESEQSIDFDGIAKRLWQLEVPNDNYTNLFANKNGLFLTSGDKLFGLEFKHDAELKEMTTKVSDVSLSTSKEHLLVVKGRGKSTNMYLMPATLSYPSKESEAKLELSNWKLAISPKDEWKSLFKDAWLMHRDSLFDQNMRGVNWQASKEKYKALLNRVTERSELNDVFEQMMGELNALHSQVRGGDVNDDPDAPTPSILGASYAETKNGVMIDTIYSFDHELLSHAPPLAQPGVNAQKGDIIVSINNQNVETIAQLKQALFNKSGQQVLLSLSRNNEDIKTIAIPTSVSDINRMRHRHWIQRNQKKVAEANADLGYIHLYAMGGQDISTFAREFYAQNSKQGLIIDVRRNRGGNIDSIIIEKLLRRAWSFWESPYWGTYSNMQNAFRGHIVVLADEFTYSDGETFTAGMKALGLATIVGKQTAGAGVWLSGQNRLADGGIARVAEFPVFDMQGNWITEGRGISPDIEVDNLPHATFKGKDAQLNRAIEILEQKLKEKPIPKLKTKPFPAVERSAEDVKRLN